MSLVTLDTYRRLTHDSTTSDEDVEAALDDAQSLIEDILRRFLTSQEYTEELYVESTGYDSISAISNGVLGTGRVYPAQTPITSVPDGYTIVGDAVVVTSTVNGVGDYPGPFLDEPYNLVPISLTYTGGWTAENLPVTLRRSICEVAFGLVQPINAALLGATSVKLGDAAISYGPDGPTNSVAGDFMQPATARRIKKWQRRFI
jgi:hypothetical protein